ncbi:type II toxin-antitoxin system VapC family toxin [Brevundimonas sp. 2YAF1]|uniref:type II toxin-antitoxin system VapC family toxin n=1 Tax=Brevundimonas sp. 2YAF1 TaxID=3233024 RepID=UPI003F904349
MKTVTVDASAAASWIFPGQATRAADAFLMAEEPRRFIAPSIFAWELGNQILNRARKSGASAADMLGDLQVLEVEVAVPPAADAVLASVDSALSRRLNLFDNAYLQLCIDQDAALASRDADLLQAAVVLGVEIFDLRD